MSNRVSEFNEIMDKLLERSKDGDQNAIQLSLRPLSRLMEDMTEQEMLEIYTRNKNEYNVLINAAKLLSTSHPNRKYLIKLYMNKYLDMMIIQNKNIKEALDSGDLNAEDLLKEMEIYEKLNKREAEIVEGEESFRKRKQGKTVYNKTRSGSGSGQGVALAGTGTRKQNR